MNVRNNGVVLLGAMFFMMSASANLLSDGTFAAGTGTYPDEKTTPWFATGEKGGWAVLTDADRSFDDAGNSLKFNRWRGDVNVLQNTGRVIEPGGNYHVSLRMLTADPSDNPEHTAKPGLFVTLASAKDPSGPYHFRKQFFWETTTSKHGEWQRIDGTIDADDLKPWAGEYLQLRIVKRSLNSSHSIWVDDVRLTRVSMDNRNQLPAYMNLVACHRQETSRIADYVPAQREVAA